MAPTTFPSRWFRWNAIAWLAGFLPFSPIAHGITGGHTPDLTPIQYLAHSAAMAVAAIVVALAQTRALSGHVAVSRVRIPITVVGFVAASWIGYSIPVDLDSDVLIGFLVLGSATWIGTFPIKGHPLAAGLAILSFPIASFVIELTAFTLVSLLNLTPDFQAHEWQHALFWIIVGGGSGMLGGLISGRALGRMLPASFTPPASRRG